MRAQAQNGTHAREPRARVFFLDYLRVVAIFMVMLVHACEQYYFNADGDFCFATPSEGFWAVVVDSACRASVPLFVMASAYLLFPVTRPTGEFLKRRFLRVFVPFAVFCCAYNFWNGGDWGQMAFNFPMATGGHLWFVPMILGLYLLMPLLSPWAEKVSERELRGWILVWLLTAFFPYLRRLWGALYGAPSFGAVPFLYGECPWNAFGTFHYVSGFAGYMLLGLWFRRFAPTLTRRQALAWAAPLWTAGYAVVALGFWLRVPFDGSFPLTRPYATAVDLEMSWEFCSFGVALTVVAYFLVLRTFTWDGAWYRRLVRPLAEASYGLYLVHIFILVPIFAALKTRLPAPVAIFVGAFATFAAGSAFIVIVRRIPVVGKWI